MVMTNPTEMRNFSLRITKKGGVEYLNLNNTMHAVPEFGSHSMTWTNSRMDIFMTIDHKLRTNVSVTLLVSIA